MYIPAPSQVSIHSAAETLLIFLESLREPVVPFSLFHRWQMIMMIMMIMMIIMIMMAAFSPEIGRRENTLC